MNVKDSELAKGYEIAKEGYKKAFRKLSDISNKSGVTEEPLYHILSAICRSVETVDNLEANKRFYVPKAILKIMQNEKSKGRPVTVKYPRGHIKLSAQLDPFNVKDSFVFHVKELARLLAHNVPTFLRFEVRDFDSLRSYIRWATRYIQRRIPILDWAFFKHHLLQTCDFCKAIYTGMPPPNPLDTVQEVILYLDDFKNRIVANLERLEDDLMKCARDQKPRKRGLKDDGDVLKNKQYKKLREILSDKKHTNVSQAVRRVLKEIPSVNGIGYSEDGLRKRWQRRTKQ